MSSDNSKILYGGDITIGYSHYASLGDQLYQDLKKGGDKPASVSYIFSQIFTLNNTNETIN